MKRCHKLLLVLASSLLIYIGCGKKTTAPDTEPPAVPALVIPADKTEYTSDDNIIQFSWKTVKDAEFYHIQVSDKLNFLNIIADENNVDNSSIELNNIFGEGIFYWRVSSLDQSGNTSEWSNVFTFLVNLMMDIDDNIYKSIKIGSQWWLAENLKVTKYRNGDPIPEETDNSTWADLSTGARCVYDNDESNANTHGYLYNWYAVDDARNIAAPGWHVPTDEEWKTLEMALGMSKSESDDTGWRGTNEGSKLADRADLWNNGNLDNNAAFGESGYSALPDGYRQDDGYFLTLGGSANFWSSTERSDNFAWPRVLHYFNSDVGRSSVNKDYGFSIRLVRD